MVFAVKNHSYSRKIFWKKNMKFLIYIYIFFINLQNIFIIVSNKVVSITLNFELAEDKVFKLYVLLRLHQVILSTGFLI